MKAGWKNKVTVALGLFLLPVLSSVLEAQSGVRFWEKTLGIDPTRPVNLSFKDVDGDLAVTASTEKTVEIRTRLESLSKDQKLAARLLEETKVDVSQRGNTIEVNILYPRLRAIFFPLRDYRRVKVSTEIAVPPETNLAIRLVDGGARVKGRLGEVNLTTVDGSAWLEEIEGRLNLKTVDGRITVREGKGLVEAHSVDGDILLRGKLEPLRVETTDGDIAVELQPGTAISRPWNLSTIDGDIEFFLPEEISADLILETGDGSVRCDLALTFSEAMGKRKLSGRLNQGGPVISLRTVEGHILVKPTPPARRTSSSAGS